MGFSVVVLETDPRVAQSLAGKLSLHFHAVHLTGTGDGSSRARRQEPSGSCGP